MRAVVLVPGVGCALAAQHAASGGTVPGWVVGASLLAIAAGFFAFDSPTPQAGGTHTVDTLPRTADSQMTALVARSALLLMVTTAVAMLLWSISPYAVRIHAYSSVWSTWAAIIWAGGIVGALLAVARRQTGEGTNVVSRSKPAVPRLELLLLLGIVLFGGVLRLWHLDVLPEGVWSDEVDSAQDALRLLKMPFQAFAPGNFGHNPCLYFYVMAGLFKLLGNSVLVLRLTSACFGVVAIVVVYLLGRAGGGPAAGLIAAAMMAFAPWAITFSRVGMPDIPVPAVTGLGYVALIYAMRDARPRAFALAGTFLGLSFLTYPGAYVPAFTALAVLAWRVRRDRAYRARSWPARRLLPLGMLAAAAPTLIVILRDPDYALARVRYLSVFGEYHDLHHRIVAVMSNTRAYLFMFTVAGDQNGRHNLPGAPLLDPLTGACLLLGLGICLRRISHWYFQIVLLWLGANLVSGVFSVDYEAPHAARTLGALAPVLVLAALPLALLAKAIRPAVEPRFRAVRKRWAGEHPSRGGADTAQSASTGRGADLLVGLLLCSVLGIGAVLGIHRYFVAQATDHRVWTAMNGLQAVMARAIPPLQREGYAVAIAPGVPDDWTIAYLAPGWEPRTFSPRAPLPAPLPAGGAALIVPANQYTLVAQLRQRYPGIQLTRLSPAFDRTDTVAYVLRWRPNGMGSG